MAQGDQGRPCWSGTLWSHCWSPADPREAAGALAESEAGVWLQPVSFPLVSRKLLRNPWGKGQVPPAPPVLSSPVT